MHKNSGDFSEMYARFKIIEKSSLFTVGLKKQKKLSKTLIIFHFCSNFFFKILDGIMYPVTFALPIRKIGLDYVSKNQNKTTILRPQLGR